MEPVRSFADLIERVKSDKGLKRVAVVCPHDSHTEEVVLRALEESLAAFLIVTDNPNERAVKNIRSRFPMTTEVYVADDADSAAHRAVTLVRDGKADVLFKGLINTDNFLRAVLNKEHGLLEPGRVMSHITFTESDRYSKLLAFSDVAVIPRPTLEQYDAIVGYACDVCRRLGVTSPRVALLHCTEKVSEKFPHTISYEEIKRRAAEGKYGDMYADGPMDVKTACDFESGVIKGMSSPVIGNADILVFPNIESGNIFYKTMTFFAGSEIAANLLGTMAPVVLPSRADSSQSKYNSLALACLQGESKISD